MREKDNCVTKMVKKTSGQRKNRLCILSLNFFSSHPNPSHSVPGVFKSQSCCSNTWKNDTIFFAVLAASQRQSTLHYFHEKQEEAQASGRARKWCFNFNMTFSEASVLVMAVADCSTFKVLYAFLSQLLEDRYETLISKAKAT